MENKSGTGEGRGFRWINLSGWRSAVAANSPAAVIKTSGLVPHLLPGTVQVALIPVTHALRSPRILWDRAVGQLQKLFASGFSITKSSGCENASLRAPAVDLIQSGSLLSVQATKAASPVQEVDST